MGGDHHHAVIGQFTDEPQHLLDLDEVQVRRRLVGQDQRRIQSDGARHRDALLLSSRHVTGAVRHPV